MNWTPGSQHAIFNYIGRTQLLVTCHSLAMKSNRHVCSKHGGAEAGELEAPIVDVQVEGGAERRVQLTGEEGE